MTNKEVFATIKEVNAICDKMFGLSIDSKEYGDCNLALSMLLDSITINCPRWKYYRSYEVHFSKRTNHYWVTFEK